MRIDLLPGEHVIVRTRPVPLRLVGPVIGGLLILGAAGFALGYLWQMDLPGLGDRLAVLLVAVVPVVVLLVLVVVWPLLRWSSTHYVLTSRRLIHRSGVSSHKQDELRLSGGLPVNMKRSPMQRMAGSGTLTVGAYPDQPRTYRDVPQLARFREYLELATDELASTRSLDGVDVDGGRQHHGGGIR